MNTTPLKGKHQSSQSRSRPLRETAAGLIIFRRGREGLRFLLVYHGNSYWNFPKGKLERNEKLLDAALRETEEETGLGQKDLRILNNFKAHENFSFYRQRRKVMKTVTLYLAESKTLGITLSSEHAGYGWFSFREAKDILSKYKENLEIIKSAHAFLSRGRKRSRKRTPRKRTQ